MIEKQPLLPTFIRPMLAQRGQPFDSREYLFEVKWDGIRALAFVDQTGYRLMSRHGRQLTDAFPELAPLADLPPGSVLDGELVVLQHGRPLLSLVQGRQLLRAAHKVRVRSQTTPATYLVFDQLFDRYRSVLNEPLDVRRRIMRETLGRAGQERLVASEGVVGAGTVFYEEVVSRQLEGVMAKRRDSLYQPGRRSGAWLKIKPGGSLKVYAPSDPAPVYEKEPV